MVRTPYRSARDAAVVRTWCRSHLDRWTVTHRRQVIDTTLGETHLVSAGDGNDVCLFLPGTNFAAATSTTLLTSLAQQYRVYAADLPGQPGLSAPNRPSDELVGYASWITDVLSWVRVRHPGSRTVLTGHSRGAAVALSSAPDEVHGLALLSPAGLIPARPSVAMLQATLPWLLRRGDDGSRRLLTYMSGPGHQPAADQVEWMTLLARTTRTTGAPGPLPAGTVSGWRGRNVRILVGAHDAFFPLERLKPRARSLLGLDPVVVPGAGHLVTQEAPSVVTQLVAGLLSGPGMTTGSR